MIRIQAVLLLLLLPSSAQGGRHLSSLLKKPHGAGSYFIQSLEKQEQKFSKDSSLTETHQIFRRRWGSPSPSEDSPKPEKRPISKDSMEYYVRVGLAGGFGGAMGTTVLYPADSAKTLRQSNPDRYRSVGHALKCLLCTTSNSVSSAVISARRQWHIHRAYAGLLPSALGAIPSSALYFGAYEGMKRTILRMCPTEPDNGKDRLWIHALSAASGNVLSSAIFVPKEAIKQQMQYQQTSNIGRIFYSMLRDRGVRGLYSGYRATLIRNIPSAMLRFVIYEELKYRWTNHQSREDGSSTFSWKVFLAGAAAGSLASGLMTPVDVIKTRVSTGTCPIDLTECANQIMEEQGWKGLYLGAGSRMLWSGAFSSIGFGSFEAAKKWLGVAEEAN